MFGKVQNRCRDRFAHTGVITSAIFYNIINKKVQCSPAFFEAFSWNQILCIKYYYSIIGNQNIEFRSYHYVYSYITDDVYSSVSPVGVSESDWSYLSVCCGLDLPCSVNRPTPPVLLFRGPTATGTVVIASKIKNHDIQTFQAYPKNRIFWTYDHLPMTFPMLMGRGDFGQEQLKTLDGWNFTTAALAQPDTETRANRQRVLVGSPKGVGEGVLNLGVAGAIVIDEWRGWSSFFWRFIISHQIKHDIWLLYLWEGYWWRSIFVPNIYPLKSDGCQWLNQRKGWGSVLGLETRIVSMETLFLYIFLHSRQIVSIFGRYPTSTKFNIAPWKGPS